MIGDNMLVPYTDVTLWPTFDINLAPVKKFCLGFVVADTDNAPSWGGYHKTTSDFYIDKITKLRKRGGDVIVSFGGATGNELAMTTKSVNDLFLKYKSVVERYSLKSIDFDIEGPALLDIDSCYRRGQAILELKKHFPKLEISMTVPVMPYGLNADTLACMAVTPHDILNIMAMNFGREVDMGLAVTQAIQATKSQTSKPIGVTVMIGKNDTIEVFTLTDARYLQDFIKQNPSVVRLSFWSIERDLGLFGPLAKSSQVRQKKFEFSNLLKN
jgi:chitinase